MSIVREATMSRTKWKSISTCLVQAWKTGLEDKYVAPMLSHHIIGGDWSETPSSDKRVVNHLISAATLASALYSASVLDLATVACFLQLQETKLDPRKIQ